MVTRPVGTTTENNSFISIAVATQQDSSWSHRNFELFLKIHFPGVLEFCEAGLCSKRSTALSRNLNRGVGSESIPRSGSVGLVAYLSHGSKERCRTKLSAADCSENGSNQSIRTNPLPFVTPFLFAMALKADDRAEQVTFSGDVADYPDYRRGQKESSQGRRKMLVLW